MADSCSPVNILTEIDITKRCSTKEMTVNLHVVDDGKDGFAAASEQPTTRKVSGVSSTEQASNYYLLAEFIGSSI